MLTRELELQNEFEKTEQCQAVRGSKRIWAPLSPTAEHLPFTFNNQMLPRQAEASPLASPSPRTPLSPGKGRSHGLGRALSEAGAAREPELPDSLTHRGSYFWKQHPRGLQWMLLVLLPAPDCFGKFGRAPFWLPLSYSSTERGVIAYRGWFRFLVFFSRVCFG